MPYRVDAVYMVRMTRRSVDMITEGFKVAVANARKIKPYSVPLGILSPTWALAALVKPSGKETRANVLRRLNGVYLGIAVASVAWMIVRGNDVRPLQAHTWSPGYLIWAYFLWSRCAEVLIAFYRDALDKLAGRPDGSTLEFWQRVALALNSYAELILDYALIYALLPARWWREAAPSTMTDLLWYSASTITTSGGGGFLPNHWLPQLLSTLELFGGVLLLVVCFTLYASLALAHEK